MSAYNVTVVGVSGGSGSGKTTFVEFLKAELGEKNCSLIFQDSYYKDQSKHFDRDGGSVNFDHPDSIEFSLLANHLKQLKSGSEVDVPIYDFKTHSRSINSTKVAAKKIILVDGILIFTCPEIRQLVDHKIFVQTSENARYYRRLHRDVKERGRTPEGVKEQFFNQVKPMHDLFVEPAKNYCDEIISGEQSFDEIIYTQTLKILNLSHADRSFTTPEINL